MTDEQINNNTIGALIAVVLVVVLIVFMIALFGGWNQRERTAESYYESLDKAVEDAKELGRSEFSLWGRTHGVRVVFFGGDKRVTSTFGNEEENFNSFSYVQNAICVCYEEDEGEGNYNCDMCSGLDMGLEFEYPEDFESRVLPSGWKFEIVKQAKTYLIKISAITP